MDGSRIILLPNVETGLLVNTNILFVTRREILLFWATVICLISCCWYIVSMTKCCPSFWQQQFLRFISSKWWSFRVYSRLFPFIVEKSMPQMCCYSLDSKQPFILTKIKDTTRRTTYIEVVFPFFYYLSCVSNQQPQTPSRKDERSFVFARKNQMNFDV